MKKSLDYFFTSLSAIGGFVLFLSTLYLSIVFLVYLLVWEGATGNVNYYVKDRFSYYISAINHFPQYLAYKLGNFKWEWNNPFSK